MNRTSTALVAVAGLSLGLAGCGTQQAGGAGAASASLASTSTTTRSASATTSPTRTPGAQVYAIATVLENPKDAPRLCLGAVATSLPPQCGGPRITNWDWSSAPRVADVAGVRYGSYVVIGTYNGTSFTLTRPPVSPQDYTGPRPAPEPEPDFSTPCPAPDGGWHVVDPTKATTEAMDSTLVAAEKLPRYVTSWLDQSINHADAEAEPEKMNDPTKLILNVKVATDPAAAEASLRHTWGGMLCVTEGGRPQAEQQALLAKLDKRPDFLAGGPDASGTVRLTVIDDDGTIQRELDTAYGAGAVRVTSALQPYPG